MRTTTVESLRTELSTLKFESANDDLQPWQQTAIAARIRQVEAALAVAMQSEGVK